MKDAMPRQGGIDEVRMVITCSQRNRNGLKGQTLCYTFAGSSMTSEPIRIPHDVVSYQYKGAPGE